ncbi:MAG: hypothetical protein ABI268_05440 [Rhodanobacter sp.]
MNHANSYSNCIDTAADSADLEEGAYLRAKSRLLADPEALGEAVADYWQSAGETDTVTEWTLALAGADAALSAICNGDDVPAGEMQAFRALLIQVAEAKRRVSAAVELAL